MAKGWKGEPLRHGLSARGIMNARKKKPIVIKKYSNVQLYELQNNNQEKIIHSGWEKGNTYRYILEGSGDVYRELTSPIPHSSYIEEKLRRIERQIEEERSPYINEEDTYEYSYENNKKKFSELKKLWSEQPYNDEQQRRAIELNNALLEKDFLIAKIIIGQIRENYK